MENNTFNLSVTEGAINKIQEVLATKKPDTFFRIEVSSGGCAGFSVSFLLDSSIKSDDLVINYAGIKIVINKVIAEFIKDAELEYKKDILSSYFMLDVKTATEKCSCGSSFGV